MFTYFFSIFLVLQAIVVPVHGSELGDFCEDAEATFKKPGRPPPNSPRNEKDGERDCISPSGYSTIGEVIKRVGSQLSSLPSKPDCPDEEGENNCPLSPESLNLEAIRAPSLEAIPALGKMFAARCK